MASCSARRTVAAAAWGGNRGAKDMKEGDRLAAKVRGTRPRGMRLEVWVTPEERAEIATRAAEAGLSVSAYMRAAGLNHPVRSVLDLKAVADLVRVNGDLGRVAGLLKLWLAEKRGQGSRPVDVEALMKDLRALQTEMRQIMGRAVRGRQGDTQGIAAVR